MHRQGAWRRRALAAGLGSVVTLGGSTMGIAGAAAAGGTVSAALGTTAGTGLLGATIGIAGGNYSGNRMVCIPAPVLAFLRTHLFMHSR